jgi:hypothetical protein
MILKYKIIIPLKYGVYIGDYVINDVDFIKTSVLYLLYPIILYFVFDLPIIYLNVQMYYTSIVLVISYLGYRRKEYHSEYFLMGFLFSAFLSEYWEIPLYLSNGIFYKMGVSAHTEVLGKITKLAMGVLGLDYMEKIGLRNKRTTFFLIAWIFVSTLIRFYSGGHYGGYGGNSIMMWAYRLASFLVLYLNIVFK